MEFLDIATRLTGISCPIFGVSWHPTERDRQVAQRVIIFMEDRRVLYRELAYESYPAAYKSVQEIRDFLNLELMRLDPKKKLAQHLFDMRLACRDFLGVAEYASQQKGDGWRQYRNTYWEEFRSFRDIMGRNIAMIAIEYGLDVEDDLARVLPVIWGKE